VLNEILAWADGEAARTGPGLADALRRFEQRLVDDPTVVPEVLARYANAVGSTVSQAVGRDMRELHDQFDTVIVDEAARANPLDMLVALAIGRRIILVGDQEQLPHMLEPRLEAAVHGGRAMDASAVLRQSLFSRLWDLYATCPPGGITRVQRLNDQFRMHPVIGRLISDTFYGGTLKSETDAEALANNTGLFDGKPLAFVHVGGAAETGRYHRRPEAEKLADRVDALLDSLGGADWTVGVISFYAQQVGLLRQLGEERGWPARVSIGTVDAFQGREFDAVFLSCVRARGEVGFLAMPNRLNVAMSRARRLLVAFGHVGTVRQVDALNKLWERVSAEGCHDSV
jgi:superfamily I DNA and/or RNA helicase